MEIDDAKNGERHKESGCACFAFTIAKRRNKQCLKKEDLL